MARDDHGVSRIRGFKSCNCRLGSVEIMHRVLMRLKYCFKPEPDFVIGVDNQYFRLIVNQYPLLT